MKPKAYLPPSCPLCHAHNEHLYANTTAGGLSCFECLVNAGVPWAFEYRRRYFGFPIPQSSADITEELLGE